MLTHPRHDKPAAWDTWLPSSETCPEVSPSGPKHSAVREECLVTVEIRVTSEIMVQQIWRLESKDIVQLNGNALETPISCREVIQAGNGDELQIYVKSTKRRKEEARK